MTHRWLARLLVVALHLTVLAGLWLHRPTSPGGAPARQFTTVRLIPPRAQPAKRAPLPPAPPAPRRTAAPALPATAAVAPAAPAPPATAQPAAPAAATDAAPAEAPRATLRLLLPPGYAASAAAARNPALGDARSNTPRRTLEDRIADATGGSGAWAEDNPAGNRSDVIGALGERRSVLRRGDTCMEVFRSRIADSDPFNSSVAPRTVPMYGKPYKCR